MSWDIQPLPPPRPKRTILPDSNNESKNAVYCINCKWMGYMYAPVSDYALCECPDNMDVYTKSSPIYPPYTERHKQYCTDANQNNDCKHYSPLSDAPPPPKLSVWSKIINRFKGEK